VKTTHPVQPVTTYTYTPSQPSPYVVNGGHKAKGNSFEKRSADATSAASKSADILKKGDSAGYTIMKREANHPKKAAKAFHKALKGFGKRSAATLKKGDSALLHKIMKREAGPHKKGFKKGLWGHGIYQGLTPQPSYVAQPIQTYVPQSSYVSQPIAPSYVSQPCGACSSQPLTPTYVSQPYEPTIETTYEPSHPVDITIETTTTVCHDEEYEVCEDVEVDDVCETEVCYEVTDDACEAAQPEQECDQVLECQETLIPVCEVCEMVPKDVEECREKPKKECKEVMETVEKPKDVEICDDECREVMKEKCTKVPYQECHPVEVLVTQVLSEEVCEWPQ